MGTVPGTVKGSFSLTIQSHYLINGAGNGIRTRGLQLGKLTLYH